MTLIYEYMVIMFIAFLILAGIFSIGVVFLVVGLVTRFLAKKKKQVKRFPKVLIGLALPMLILPVVLTAVFVGSRIIDAAKNPIQYRSEETMFNEEVDAFFEAADRNDAQAIYDLCAASVKKENPALREQIVAFLDEYPGHPDTNERGGPVSGGGGWTDGKEFSTLSDVFVFTKDSTNFYCNLVYTYIDETDPEEVGIKYVSIRSEKVICDETFDFPDVDGIYIQLQSDETYSTRRIGGYPEIFVEYDRKITEQQVRDYLAESTSLSGFKKQFGEPNADDPNLVCFFEIEGSDGGRYYARFYYDTDEDKIEDCSGIVNDIGDYHSHLFEETDE